MRHEAMLAVLYGLVCLTYLAVALR